MKICQGCGKDIPIKDEVCYNCRPSYKSEQEIIEVKYKEINEEGKEISNSETHIKTLFNKIPNFIKIAVVCIIVGVIIYSVINVNSAKSKTDADILQSYNTVTVQLVDKSMAQAIKRDLANQKYITGKITEVEYLSDNIMSLRVNNKTYCFNAKGDNKESLVGKTALIIDLTTDSKNPTAKLCIY